jgi:DNA gyrase subunit A
VQAGLIAINLRDDDELVRVLPVNDGDELMCVSKLGQGIRFRESDVRPMGRRRRGSGVPKRSDRPRHRCRRG